MAGSKASTLSTARVDTTGSGRADPDRQVDRSGGVFRGDRLRRHGTAVLAGIPAVTVLVLALIGAGSRQLWRDEHATWWAASLSLPDLARLLGFTDIVFAPFFGYMKVWISLFGDSPLALRFPAILWMALAAALLVLLGRRLYDTPTGVVAGLLFAVLPTVSRYAAEARPYAQTLAVTIGATLLLLRALERPRPRRWVAYGAAVAAVGLSHLIALAVLAAHLVLVLRHPRDRARRLRSLLGPWLIAGLAGCAVVLPVAVAAQAQAGQIDWIPIPGWRDVVELPKGILGGWRVALPVACLALVGLVTSRWTGVVLGAWIAVAPAVTFLISHQVQLFYFRYMLFTVPAWALSAAAGALWIARAGIRATARPGGRPGRAGVGTLAGGLAAVVAVGVVGIPAQRAMRSDRVEQEFAFRPAARFIMAHSQPGDGIAFAGYLYLRRAMAYEMRNGPALVDVFLAVPANERGNYAAQECPDPAACVQGVRRIWLVTVRGGRDPLARVGGERGDVLRARYRVAQSVQFYRIRVAELVAVE